MAGRLKCSELLTEQVLYVGQLQGYGQASELLEVLTNARVSASTIYRMVSHYGQAIEEELYQEPEQKRALLELWSSCWTVEGLPLRRAESRKRRDKLLYYLRENSYRMEYRIYRQEGLMIGSGAIEAAHRMLIQQRMKLSGQRWSDEGANNLLNLSVCKMSGKWPLLIRHIKRGKEPETKT